MSRGLRGCTRIDLERESSPHQDVSGGGSFCFGVVASARRCRPAGACGARECRPPSLPRCRRSRAATPSRQAAGCAGAPAGRKPRTVHHHTQRQSALVCVRLRLTPDRRPDRSAPIRAIRGCRSPGMPRIDPRPDWDADCGGGACTAPALTSRVQAVEVLGTVAERLEPGARQLRPGRRVVAQLAGADAREEVELARQLGTPRRASGSRRAMRAGRRGPGGPGSRPRSGDRSGAAVGEAGAAGRSASSQTSHVHPAESTYRITSWPSDPCGDGVGSPHVTGTGGGSGPAPTSRPIARTGRRSAMRPKRCNRVGAHATTGQLS